MWFEAHTMLNTNDFVWYKDNVVIPEPHSAWYIYTARSGDAPTFVLKVQTTDMFTRQVQVAQWTVTVVNLSDTVSQLLNSLVTIPAGSFMMGSTDDEYGMADYTTPVHQVTLQSFDIGAYEVTQAQYLAVMRTHPSWFQAINGYPNTENNPVEQITWYDAREFCTRLSVLTGRTFDLPSEAQWEYACRAGTTSLYSYGNVDDLLVNYAWLNANSNDQTHPVGTKLPNPWGLYDMMGNVTEWCLDSDHYNYIGAPTDGSAWEPETGTFRMLRGSFWGANEPWFSRSAGRNGSYYPGNWSRGYGFRVVAVPAGTIDPHVYSENGVGQLPISQPGWGFTPGGTAELHLRSPDGSLLPVTHPESYATVGSDGRYSHVWTHPWGAMLGTYQYWAVDLSSGRVSPEVNYTLKQ
jgi:formylglycine-generating enzyme required for sulfatase activity